MQKGIILWGQFGLNLKTWKNHDFVLVDTTPRLLEFHRMSTELGNGNHLNTMMINVKRGHASGSLKVKNLKK